MSQIDYADVQGLVRFGYGQMTSASYVLVRVKNADATKAWIRSAPITTAVAQKPPPKTAMNIAVTAAGLKTLGVPESIIGGFSHEFRGGMGQESRARQLGDVGRNAPSNWNWGSYGCEPHAVVMFFAAQGQLDSFIQKARDQNWSEAFEEVTSLGTSNLDGDEPFGFADGISQPQIDWEQQLVRPWCNCRQRDFRRGGLRVAFCRVAARQKPPGARVATKFSGITADANWFAHSQIENRKSQITSWLPSFPTAPLKRKQSRGKLRRILWPVPYWRSRAIWAAARPCSRRVSSWA